EADHLLQVDGLGARQLEDLDHGEGAVQAEAETAALVAAGVELRGDESPRVLVRVEGQAFRRAATGHHGQGGRSLVEEEAGPELHGSPARHESTAALTPVAPAELSWAWRWTMATMRARGSPPMRPSASMRKVTLPNPSPLPAKR